MDSNPHPRKHHGFLKQASELNRERAVENRRQRSVAISSERRDAILRSKRLRRLFDDSTTPSSSDLKLSGLDPVTLDTAVKTAVSAAEKSQKAGGAQHRDDIRYVRKLLSESDNPPTHQMLESGALPLLANALLQHSVASPEAAETALEAIWALAHLAGGEHDVAKEILPLAPGLINYLQGSLGWSVAEVSAWALGNLAGDCIEFADTLVANGAVKPLAELLIRTEKVVKHGGENAVVVAGITAGWALTNLIRNSNVAGDQFLELPGAVERLLGMLALGHVNVVAEVAWLLTYVIAKGRNVERMLAAGVIPPLVHLLGAFVPKIDVDISNARTILTPVLRSLGNIAAGAGEEHMRQLTECEGGIGAKCMVACLKCSHRGVLKEAAWAVSNLAGSPDTVGPTAVKAAGAVPVLLELVKTAAFDVKKEAAFALANLCVGGENDEPDVELLTHILEPGHKLLPTFMSFMRCADMEAVRLGIKFTETVLRVVPGGPQMVEEVDGIDALEAVEFSQAPLDLQDLAKHLVDKYFGEDYGV